MGGGAGRSDCPTTESRGRGVGVEGLSGSADGSLECGDSFGGVFASGAWAREAHDFVERIGSFAMAGGTPGEKQSGGYRVRLGRFRPGSFGRLKGNGERLSAMQTGDSPVLLRLWLLVHNPPRCGGQALPEGKVRHRVRGFSPRLPAVARLAGQAGESTPGRPMKCENPMNEGRVFTSFPQPFAGAGRGLLRKTGA